MRITFLSFIFFLLPCCLLFAQNSSVKADSLLQKIKEIGNDTTKVNLLNELSAEYRFSQPLLHYDYATQALSIAKELKFVRGEVAASMNLYAYHLHRGNYTKALDYLQYNLTLEQDILHDKGLLAEIYTNIASVYSKGFKQPRNSLGYQFKALAIYKNLNDRQNTAQLYNNIADNYMKLNENLDSAMVMIEQAIFIAKEKQNNRALAGFLATKGEIYDQQGNYDKALATMAEAVEYKTKYRPAGVTYSLNVIGNIYLKLSKPEKALPNFLEAEKRSLKYDTKEFRARTYEGLSQTYKQLGDYKQALFFYQAHVALRDSLTDKESAQRVAVMESQHELESQKSKISLLEKDQALQNEAAIKQKVLLIALLIIVLAVGFSLFIVMRSNKKQKETNILLQQQREEQEVLNEELKQVNEELEATVQFVNEQKNEIQRQSEDITDSIKYAKRIQFAMLPFEDEFNQLVGQQNYFILFKPRDIVSGDFYWLHEIKDRNIVGHQIVTKFMIAVADCTGHGVPGALMSMIGHQLLLEIVEVRNIQEPNLILSELHKQVMRTLKQQTDTDTRDGMDIAFCTIDKVQKTIVYAGAMNSIYIVANENQMPTLIELKADKKPIGGFSFEGEINQHRDFVKQIYHIEQPITLYLFSDGYKDQFGGANKKKFKSSSFKESLLNMGNTSMKEQKEILDTAIEEWRSRGNEAQVDDITVLGIKL
jgi:serine phosphatase RsbU (regulator of sigma subunit)